MPEGERAALAAKVVGVVTVEGHALSLHNVLLIAMQCPTATIVGGFRQWIKAGRAVRKGEHGISIWVPVKPKGETEQGAAPAADPKGGDTRFIAGYVFDVSQTDEILQPADLQPA
jgi:antirestriction protein ArdC